MLDNLSQEPCGLRFGDPPDGLIGSGDPVRTVTTVSSDSVLPQFLNTTIEVIAEGGTEDCNSNGVADSCEVSDGSVPDCDENGVPDSCDIAAGAADCDENGVPDSCELAGGAVDCDENGVPDSCDIAAGAGDCDENGVPDSCEIAGGAADCDENGVPDTCDLASGAADCNENGAPDSCDIALGISDDLNQDTVPDECAPSDAFRRGDCDGDGSACSGVGDALFLLTWFFSGGDEPGCLAACDVNGDGELEGVSDAISNLNFCFQGSEPPPSPFPDCGPGTAADEVLGCLQVPATCQVD